MLVTAGVVRSAERATHSRTHRPASPGLASEWVLPADQDKIQPNQVILRTHSGNRTVELQWAQMQRMLLLELAELPMWAHGNRHPVHAAVIISKRAVCSPNSPA
jgi:hypothetical protein